MTNTDTLAAAHAAHEITSDQRAILTANLAEATTYLAQAKVALTAEARASYLDEAIELTMIARHHDLEARRIHNEAKWMR